MTRNITLRIHSGLDVSVTCQVLVQPVLNGETLVGVLERATFQPFSAPPREFLQQVQETRAVAFQTTRARARERAAD